MRTWAVIPATVLVGLAFGVSASGAPTEPSGQIAYASGDGIRIVNTDGTVNYRIMGGHPVDPTWAPDGSKLFVVSVAGSFVMETVSSDGIETPLHLDRPLPIPWGASWAP